MDNEKLKALQASVQRELAEGLMPFWQTQVIDYQNGGFIGYMDNKGDVDRRSIKGLVLNTRLLWSYSALYQFSGEDSFKTLAQRAFDYFADNFIDEQFGGAFWALDFKGNFLETKKKTYGQAFSIYALAEYYKITQEKQVIELASHFFDMLQAFAYDSNHGGYFEAFERNWKATDDLRLSNVDMNEKKSMNTQLHVMEAYANLLRIWDNKNLASKLSETINVFLDHIIDPETSHFRLFFDDAWNSKSITSSFGHDIEGSWLLVEAASILSDSQLLDKTKQIAVSMATAVLEECIDNDGGIFYEGEGKTITDSDKHWWPQAEAVVGFLNAYQISGDAKFARAAIKTWSFIEKHIIDKKEGEWFWRVSQNRKPYLDSPKVSEWKSPYHTCRACIEIINRIDAITKQDGNDRSDNG